MGFIFAFHFFASTNSSIMADADAIKKICDIYDWDGKGELDMFYLGDVVYALGFNITKKICVGLGQTDELNKKFAKYDEIVKLVQEAVKVPEGSGNYHDYINYANSTTKMKMEQ